MLGVIESGVTESEGSKKGVTESGGSKKGGSKNGGKEEEEVKVIVLFNFLK